MKILVDNSDSCCVFKFSLVYELFSFWKEIKDSRSERARKLLAEVEFELTENVTDLI